MKIALTVFLVALALPVATSAAFPLERQIMHATGTFDVKVVPQKADNPQAEASGLGRLSLDKQFHGALEARSQGEMLAAGDGKSAGAYVALETVRGALQGREGSFMLVHRALLVGGAPQEWTVAVVPESGTGALEGLSGSMRIDIRDGVHAYDLTYTLPGGG